MNFRKNLSRRNKDKLPDNNNTTDPKDEPKYFDEFYEKITKLGTAQRSV